MLPHVLEFSKGSAENRLARLAKVIGCEGTSDREKAERFIDAVRDLMAKSDIPPRLDALLGAGQELRNMDTGAPLTDIRDRITSANVYLGAFPIAEALAQGANIVLTGRGTDPGLVLGPLIHEFGWSAENYDLLAAGTVAGQHVVVDRPIVGNHRLDPGPPQYRVRLVRHAVFDGRVGKRRQAGRFGAAGRPDDDQQAQ